MNVFFGVFFLTERGAKGDGGARLPGPAVPDRRGHRAHHEDAQDADPQPAHHRTVQSAQLPRQGRFGCPHRRSQSRTPSRKQALRTVRFNNDSKSKSWKPGKSSVKLGKTR